MIKRALLLFLFILYSDLILSQTSNSLSEIDFRNLDFESASNLAATENKPLCVLVYSLIDSVKLSTDMIIRDKVISDFYNSQFINGKIPANTEGSKKFFSSKGLSIGQSNYEITNYRTPDQILIFFDSKGKFNHFGYFSKLANTKLSKEEYLGHGMSAMNQEMRADHFENRFRDNDKSPQFLIDYVRYLFIKMDSEGIHRLFKRLPEILEDSQIKSSLFGFYALQYLNSRYKDAQSQYFFENLDLFRKLYDSRDVKFVGEMLLNDALYHQNLQPVELTLKELDEIRKNFEKISGSHGEAAGLIFAHTVKAYLKINDVKGAIAFANKNIQYTLHEGSTYLFLLQCFNKDATGDEYDRAFEKWSDKCLKAWRRMAFCESDLALTYYEMAEFYWKRGKKLRAGDLATTAFNLSKASKNGFRPGESEKIQAQYNQYGSRK